MDSGHPVIVVGAGPAGLAASNRLRARGIDHVVLERGAAVGFSWRNFYDSLVLHTGKHLSSLPGMPFARSDPMFVPRARFVAYLEAYARRFDLPIRPGVEVRHARQDATGWSLLTSHGRWRASVLIVATGIAANPRQPTVDGLDQFSGRRIHSIEYHEPSPFVGRRVLVVGAGNSGAEIAAELAAHGIHTAISIRSGVTIVPLTVAGIPSQYLGLALRRLPRPLAARIAALSVYLGIRRRRDGLPRSTRGPLDAIPVIGSHLSDAVRAGRLEVRPGVAACTSTGVTFVDGRDEAFDDIIFATGFATAVSFLGGLVALDARGFARRNGRVIGADAGGLLFVGHTYDASGGLANIRRDAPLAAAAAARMLASEP
jgi:putative flavoprotein involved in K+ transport